MNRKKKNAVLYTAFPNIIAYSQSQSGVTSKQLHSITVKLAVHSLFMSDFYNFVRINMLCSVTFMIQESRRNGTI